MFEPLQNSLEILIHYHIFQADCNFLLPKYTCLTFLEVLGLQQLFLEILFWDSLSFTCAFILLFLCKISPFLTVPSENVNRKISPLKHAEPWPFTSVVKSFLLLRNRLLLILLLGFVILHIQLTL